MQQPNLFPFGSVLGNPFLLNNGVGDLSDGGFDSSRVFFLVPFLLFQVGGMDLSKVGEKILSSVRSARSLGLLPSDRAEVSNVAQDLLKSFNLLIMESLLSSFVCRNSLLRFIPLHLISFEKFYTSNKLVLLC